MRSVKFIMAAGAASLMSTAVLAADMAIAPPPPQMYAPPPVEDFGGWYLRGDIGFSNQKVKKLETPAGVGYNAPNTVLEQQSLGFDTGGIYQVGVGYQFNNWFRADITGQFRGSSNFHGYDRFSFTGPANVGIFQSEQYGGRKTEWVAMANAYVDLGTWWCVTPFIGAGVGMARVTVADFTDQNLQFRPGAGVFAGSAYADAASKWNFAWALHTGLAYKVNPNMTVELGYSYMNLGDGVTGSLTPFTGAVPGQYAVTFKDITSHDLKLGVRWNLEAAPVYAPPPPPLIRKG
ncbi:outer membrane protein [Tardiphaga sp.]|uniref:outer membrane protein n=1 Tax=Tardiphaga sp. TaxID=1926292 RepID=UPI0037DA28A0